ncbi:surface lipoprotein assembly modifier [Sulfurospirillum arsenophilum]|uniref:surface lipoprotein assembly modifier n=1 Tax=Sulfurospirillum arsenophilum TaxID=56698 RepID=UPI0005A6A3D4|nr:tetratricopeptide repeat protein [Sulfurospirillum arsenophilum]
MKKILIICCIISSLLASSLETFKSDYDQALKLYNSGDFQNASIQFYALSEVAPENVEVNFYLGRSSLELKHYDDAVSAFDRVLILNPSHVRTKLELARLYFEIQQYDTAQSLLDGVLQEQLPLTVQENVVALKSAIDQQRAKHTFGGALILAWDYDTNIGNDVGRGVTQNVLSIIDLPGNNQRKSAGLAQTLVLNHSYDMGEKGGFAWDTAFIAYNKNLTQYSDKDLMFFSLSTGPSYTYDIYKLSLQAGYDKVRLESDDYMNITHFSLNLKAILTPELMLETDITQKRNLHTQSSNTTDSDATLYTMGVRYALNPQDPWIIAAYISYKDENERDKAAAQYGVSLDEWSYRLELSKEIFKDFRATIGYTYKDTNYKEFDALFNLKRSDTEDYYSTSLSYMLTKQSSVMLSYAYSDHASNNALYTYKKNVTALSYIYSF